MTVASVCVHSAVLPRASVKLFELGIRTPGGLFLGLWYVGSRQRHQAEPNINKHGSKPVSMQSVYQLLSD